MASAFPLKIVFLLFCVISCIMAMVALFTNNWYKVDGETFGLLPKHCQKTEGVDDEHAKHCKELIDKLPNYKTGVILGLSLAILCATLSVIWGILTCFCCDAFWVAGILVIVGGFADLGGAGYFYYKVGFGDKDFLDSVKDTPHNFDWSFYVCVAAGLCFILSSIPAFLARKSQGSSATN